MQTIGRVAVLGAGTMGSRIAAHFANAGIPARLLDVVLPNEKDRNAAARKGIETAARTNPKAFFTDSTALVTPGNFEDDLGSLTDCDWIIEAVTENLDIKRALWTRVAEVRRPGSIASTNTSGIPLARISEGFSKEFRSHFLGTHFFNPPRYLHLLEVIRGAETDPAVLRLVYGFADRRLGKGVVPCKDTPNFIANRIGSFYGSTIYKLTMDDGFSVEEVDALTGQLIGVPKSASYRLLDLVGLDVWAFVARNLYDLVPTDPWRERFLPPAFANEMMARGWIGEKAGQGFYKRVGKDREIHALDWKTLEYHPAQKPKFPEIEQTRLIEDLPARLRALIAGPGRSATFLWRLFSDVLLYSAERVPEISDRIVEIDRAMRWGYGHKLGPFELWDALGFEAVCARLEKEGRVLPPSIVRMRERGVRAFYRSGDEAGRPRTEYYDLLHHKYSTIEDRPGVIHLSEIKRARGVIAKNPGASLIDLGDGVVCVEFHSKMNALGEDGLGMIYTGLEETARNHEAMVIANHGDSFSAGANLMLLLLAAQEGDWDDLDLAIRRFQHCTMALKYAPKPVVAAPFSHVLGGGAEVVLHCARAQASAETYMGLVEVGVGLIPAAGGCKEMLVRFRDPRKVFELIGYAKVSTSAEDARNLGLLHKADRITMNPERLIGDAKSLALTLASSYRPGVPRTDIKVGGETAYASMKLGAWMLHQGGYISDHDLLIAEKLANILSGGRLTGEQSVSEQHLLDLEREAFLSLIGTEKSQQRIQHMLKTGKPLRN